MKILDTYTFKGFGFDILLRNIQYDEVEGAIFPLINMNELKSFTAKFLLTSNSRLTGYHFKFLRTYLNFSMDEVSSKIHVSASTLRSWENRGNETTGLTVDQEKAFRILTTNQMLDNEKNRYNIEVTLVSEFSVPASNIAIDIKSTEDAFVAIA